MAAQSCRAEGEPEAVWRGLLGGGIVVPFLHHSFAGRPSELAAAPRLCGCPSEQVPHQTEEAVCRHVYCS